MVSCTEATTPRSSLSTSPNGRGFGGSLCASAHPPSNNALASKPSAHTFSPGIFTSIQPAHRGTRAALQNLHVFTHGEGPFFADLLHNRDGVAVRKFDGEFLRATPRRDFLHRFSCHGSGHRTSRRDH